MTARASKAVVPHATPDLDWLAKQTEEVLEPELPIVDPHHHLWDRWGGYFLDDLLEDVSLGHNIVATVFLQCGYGYRADGPKEMQPVGETEFVVSVAEEARHRGIAVDVCAGIVGMADLALGAPVEAVLDAHLEAAKGRFRGVRQITSFHKDFEAGALSPPPPGLLADAKFRDGFSRLEDRGLTFDALVYHTQLDELADLAAAFPDMKIVANHCGYPLGVGPYRGKRDAVLQEWRAGMARLAAQPNVYVKLGGLGMAVMGFDFHKQPQPPSSGELVAAWGPYFESCIEAFGVERCMFESNFPVDKAMCSYTAVWNAFKRVTSGASAAERHALFLGTAAEFYRLEV